jgi:hypothetical protein
VSIGHSDRLATSCLAIMEKLIDSAKFDLYFYAKGGPLSKIPARHRLSMDLGPSHTRDVDE